MDISLILLTVLVITALFTAFKRGRWPLIREGLGKSAGTLRMMWWRVLLGIILAGFVQMLIPRTLIAEWIGPASGLTGILIGTFAGMIMTGGAFVVMPVIASVYTAGAAAGPIIALITAANLTRVQGLFVVEIPFFGTRIALSRYLISLCMPPLVGLAGSLLFRLF
ncbi:MAG: permease [Pseudomonadota bacterium]